MLATIIHE